MEKTIKNKRYQTDDEVEEIIKKVIKDEKLDLDSVRLGSLLVYPNISKTKAGTCTKTNSVLKFYSDTDYILQFSGELWDTLTEKTRYILVFHELLHILPVNNEKKGEIDFKLRDHDLKDFRRIVTKYGFDWIDQITESVKSLYDLDDKHEISI